MEESSGDRISALPDSIIHHILSFLPSTKEAIRTAILSKRWQNQWTHVPVLNFGPGEEDNGFIENTLILHDCPKIKKFELQYDFDDDHRFTTKIRFAIRKCVEELILIRYSDDDSYLLPKTLLDNASLTRLHTANCHFMRDWTVNWPSLKSLKMDCRSSSVNDNTGSQCIGNVVSGSPLLDSLEFRGTLGENDAIVSKSLKKLSFVDVEIPVSTKISCPNLVELHVLTDLWDESTFPDQMIENVLLGSPLIQSLELVNFIGFANLVIASKSLKVLCLEITWEHSQPIKIEVSCPNLEKLDVLYSDDEFHAVNLLSSISATLDYVYPRNDNSAKKMLEQFQDVNKLQLRAHSFGLYQI